jgi:antitoxin component of MazEF toxin-antitoxin module
MSSNFFYEGIELEQDAYGSAVINLPDELCHDLGLQPGERFEVEADDESLVFKRVAPGYEVEA